MFAVIYRWRLRPGMEHQACARWPDEAARERCSVPDAEGVAMMAVAVEERFPETRLQIVDDLLAEPGTP
ncbi:hypothetical protein [Streptomyces virginiae]|uniref:hypothetical protein n=1 Tax=Streptomyces virginiae TaxID=1961 RepID=UPI00344811A1